MAQSLEAFFEELIHTDRQDVPALRDNTAAKFLLKMCSEQAEVTFKFGRNLIPQAVTPDGTYTFVFQMDDDDEEVIDLVVDSVV